MVLEKLDNHIQKNKIEPLSYIILKNHNKIPENLAAWDHSELLLSLMVSMSQEFRETNRMVQLRFLYEATVNICGAAVTWILHWRWGIHIQDGSLTW